MHFGVLTCIAFHNFCNKIYEGITTIIEQFHFEKYIHIVYSIAAQNLFYSLLQRTKPVNRCLNEKVDYEKKTWFTVGVDKTVFVHLLNELSYSRWI